MINNNLNYKIVPLFNSNKIPVSQPGTSESIYNNGYSVFTLEINGTAAGRIEGCINIINPNGEPKTDEECSWSPLAIIDMKDYSVSQSFSASGKYVIGINGMARFRVVLTSVSDQATLVGVMEA